MSKFLFVVPPFFGHISPTLSVGASLLARGHDVKWYGVVPLSAGQVPEGGEYIYPEAGLTDKQEELQHILRRQDDGPGSSGPEVMKLALAETYVPLAMLMKESLMKVLIAWQPDVVVNDCITFAGALCAHLRGIPCVTTTPVPPDVMGDTANTAPKIFAWQQELIRGLQAGYGIYGGEIRIHSAKLNIVFTSSAFAGFKNCPPELQFVGPVKGRPSGAAFDWDRLKNVTTPKIFVSLGTLLVDIRKDFFQQLVDTFATEPVTIIAATDPEILEKWPDNFIAGGFVPQAELMPEMDLVICHGGFNTVNDTFMNGLPMLIIPIAYDHFHTAKLIVQAGCGISIRYKRLRAAALRAAVFELLENPVYREAAMRIRETFIAAGGNHKAVCLLEKFAAEEHVTTTE